MTNFPESLDDRHFVDIIQKLEQGNVQMKQLQADSESRLNKRALAVAITHLETAQLWLAYSRPE
jgi:hypothetical protein